MTTADIARVAVGCTRQGLMVGRSALPADFTPMLGLRSRRITRCAHRVRFARTDAASRFTKRAQARRPQACASRRPTNRPCRVPPTARVTPLDFAKSNALPAKGRSGRSQRAYAAPRSAAAVAARASAPRQPIRRVCSNEANAVSVVSYATDDGREHRREVGAKRRPPQWRADACPHTPLRLRSLA